MRELRDQEGRARVRGIGRINDLNFTVAKIVRDNMIINTLLVCFDNKRESYTSLFSNFGPNIITQN